IATAGLHLFDRADELAILGVALEDVVHHEEVHGESGPEIEGVAAARHDALLPLQMALLAHRLAQRVFQSRWVDDGVIDRAEIIAPTAGGDVQLTRPMTALAADAQTAKHRLPIAVDASRHVIGEVAMTEQTGGRD